MSPSTCATANKPGSAAASASARAGEQAFDLFDVPPVGDEHDDVVVVRDHGVVVRDVHIVASHHGADDGTFGKRDLVHAPAHHSRCPVRAVHHGLKCLGGTAAQRMHAYHVATPHVREQGADGDGLRRD